MNLIHFALFYIIGLNTLYVKEDIFVNVVSFSRSSSTPSKQAYYDFPSLHVHINHEPWTGIAIQSCHTPIRIPLSKFSSTIITIQCHVSLTWWSRWSIGHIVPSMHCRWYRSHWGHRSHWCYRGHGCHRGHRSQWSHGGHWNNGARTKTGSAVQ